MQNLEIREAAQKAGVRLWRIADELGICEATFSRKLRYEFEPEMKQKALAAIRKLAKT